MGDVLVELPVLVVADLAAGTGPQGGRGVDGLVLRGPVRGRVVVAVLAVPASPAITTGTAMWSEYLRTTLRSRNASANSWASLFSFSTTDVPRSASASSTVNSSSPLEVQRVPASVPALRVSTVTSSATMNAL